MTGGTGPASGSGGAGSASGGAAGGRRRPRPVSLARMLSIGAALGLGIVAGKRWVADVHRVVEPSMWPTLEGGIDHVLVNKLAREPRRFEVWLYESEGRGGSFDLRIKRVLATGGESIDFRDGDVWVGPAYPPATRLCRPKHVVDAMLIPLHPGCDPPPPERFSVRAGVLDAAPRGRLRLDGRAGPVRAVLHGSAIRSLAGIFDDHLGPRGQWMTGTRPVPDVRIDVVVRRRDPEAVFRVIHELEGQERRSVALGPMGLEVSGSGDGETRRLAGPAPAGAEPAGFRLETIDGTFRVAMLDPDTGAEQNEIHVSERDTSGFGNYSAISIEAIGGVVELARLDARRDVHYFKPQEFESINQGYFVPPGSAFLVGDNVPVSEDSREHGPVLYESLEGRAVKVVWPAARSRGLP